MFCSLPHLNKSKHGLDSKVRPSAWTVWSPPTLLSHPCLGAIIPCSSMVLWVEAGRRL